MPAMMETRNLQMFAHLFTGYMIIVYVRQAISFSAPVISKSENLGDNDLGLIISSQMMGYTIVKFIGGTLADMVDGGLTFMVCLILSGFCALLFTAFSSVPMFAIIWFICGLAQGPAWSACAVLMKKHFPASQLATWWSILSTSSNVAGTVGPFASQALVSAYGWRSSFIWSGLSSLFVGLLSARFFMNLNREQKTNGKEPLENKKDSSSSVRVLYNPIMITTCIVYFLFTFVRGACSDWGQHYLINIKGQSLLLGSSFISANEVGGIVGSIVAGYASDKLMSKAKHPSSPRVLLIIGLTSLKTVALYFLIFHIGESSSQILINIVSFFIGFGLYGNIALIGIVAMEIAPDNMAGTAHSFAALAANFGRVVSGYPLTLVATHFSWHESFILTLFISALAIGVSSLLLKMINDKHMQEKRDKSS